MSKAPLNVIILHCDELRGDCTGFAGNPQVATPCMDAFAGDAIQLERHFTVHGKCIPSRVAMMTGRYAHAEGARTVMEADQLPAHRPDLMKTLKANGYETAVFGINHCWADFWNDNRAHGTVDYHSFIEGDFGAISGRQVVLPPAGKRADCPVLADGFDLGGRLLGRLGAFSDDVRADAAIHYLEHVRDRSRPFFMQLNISAPHPPYAVEEPWFSQYDPATMRIFPHQLPRGATLPLRAQREYRTGTGEIAESSLREVLATYYGMISKVDALFGRVLSCIAEQGLSSESLILLTSDHGDFAGQYGLCEKFDTVLADCLLRVPCLLRAPGLPHGLRIDALTQHVDLAPTILDLLGIAPAPGWTIHGVSLLPVLAGTLRPSAVFADGGHEAGMRTRHDANSLWRVDARGGAKHQNTAGKQHTYHFAPESMARCCMVRTEHHKLIMRETGEHELYHLDSDPWELDNRYGDAALAVPAQQLMEHLLRWQLRTMNDQTYHAQVMA